MDWKPTLEEILAGRRRLIGQRPDLAHLVRLREDDLPESERQHLLEQAAVDPELARLLLDILRFPELPSSDRLSREEEGVEQRWLAFFSRLEARERPSGPQPGRARRASARSGWWRLAATFLLGIAVASSFGRWTDPAEPSPGSEPRINMPIVELLPGPGSTRMRSGPEAVALAANADALLLTLAVPEHPLAAQTGPYTLNLVGPDGATTTIGGLTPGLGGVFVLDVPRDIWADGLYELQLISSARELVARFQLEVKVSR